jgi:hypothetical protein
MGRRGTILVENIIFIVLNLVFLAILVLFLFSKMGSAAVLEEKYAKQIALIIDSAKPGMEISLNMEDAVEKANDEGWKEQHIVSIQDNIVTVQLREKGGYSYSFFNNVELSKTFFYDYEGENYIFKVEAYKQNEQIQETE